jgi:hypothetical protein
MPPAPISGPGTNGGRLPRSAVARREGNQKPYCGSARLGGDGAWGMAASIRGGNGGGGARGLGRRAHVVLDVVCVL